MQTAIERRNPAGGTAGLQDTAIERILDLPQTTTGNNSKSSDWLDEIIREAVTNAAANLTYGGRQL